MCHRGRYLHNAQKEDAGVGAIPMYIVELLLLLTCCVEGTSWDDSSSWSWAVILYKWCPVTTMSSSGSYPVTLVASQYSSPTPVAHSYSGHSRADMPPLSTILGLYSIHSLPHLAVYPARSWVLRVLDISCTLYHFHRTWFILPRPDLVLSPVIPCPLFRLFTCHRKCLSLVLT